MSAADDYPELLSLADRWSAEASGAAHVASCKVWYCSTCAVVACASELRAALR